MKKEKIKKLSRDVIQFEINALKSLNFRKYNPKLICVEIHNYPSSKSKINNLKSNPIYSFLLRKSYREVWNNEFSFIFKRN